MAGRSDLPAIQHHMNYTPKTSPIVPADLKNEAIDLISYIRKVKSCLSDKTKDPVDDVFLWNDAKTCKSGYVLIQNNYPSNNNKPVIFIRETRLDPNSPDTIIGAIFDTKIETIDQLKDALNYFVAHLEYGLRIKAGPKLITSHEVHAAFANAHAGEAIAKHPPEDVENYKNGGSVGVTLGSKTKQNGILLYDVGMWGQRVSDKVDGYESLNPYGELTVKDTGHGRIYIFKGDNDALLEWTLPSAMEVLAAQWLLGLIKKDD